MSQDVYDVIIVGAGPAGLSAAAHAHVCGMSYLLLEQRRLANTLDYYYQRGKFVMTLPALIPLRSDMPFAAGSREEVLRTWKTKALEYQLHHSHASVQKITKRPPEGLFAVETAQHVYTATHVVIAIGKKGNPNRLGVPGEDLPHVADRLEDPRAYTGASIVVVGGGDAAAEIALALSERNHVTLSYRQEALRPDKMNETLRGRLQEKIARGEIQAVFNSEVQRIDPEIVVLTDPQGTRRVRAERVFLLLGASVPTHFLQRCGVTFSSDPSVDRQAVPRVDDQYQAVGVEGLYLIGSLTGKDLIKAAMNQGWDVIEYIAKRPVEPIDNALLSARLRVIPGDSVEAQLATITSMVPLWRDTPLPQLRELLLLSTVRYVHQGDRLFDKGQYSTTFFTIVEGGVDIEVAPGQTVQRGVGEFFGEMSLLSDVPRSACVTATADTLVIETPRHALLKLLDAVPAVQHSVEQQWIPRALHMYLSPSLSAHAFQSLTAKVMLQTFTKGEVIFREGEPGEAMYIICGGVIKLSTMDAADKELVIAYRSVGTFIGEMALFGAMPPRSATATAMNRTTVMCLTKRDFLAFVQAYPGLYDHIHQEITRRVLETTVIREVPRSVELLSHFLKHGVVESTDVLLIDETKCIRCDNCVSACAATHQGQTRLDRPHGPSFAQVHVPVACRHCVGAPCLLDCPPGDAIARDDNGVVRIDPAKCIGCGNCAAYCPYGVIFMVAPPAPAPKFWERLEFRLHRANGKDQPAAAVDAPRDSAETQSHVQSTCAVCAGYAYEQAAVHEEKAIKCDLCADLKGGPACVASCPTGAAIRVSAEALPFVDFR